VTSNVRIERDSLGEVAVPAERYYGAQTQRALENFPITGTPIAHFRELIRAFALIKKACAQANCRLGLLPERVAAAIAEACDDVANGELLQEFVVDVIQGGAGTSTNMNANEVLANRALEKLGLEKGRYDEVHPNDHVNLSQSTNDVYPTALRLALIFKLRDLTAAVSKLAGIFQAKGEEFADVVKLGRTEMQDAVPVTLGREFRAWGVMLAEDEKRLAESMSLIREVNLGATAVGTGLNCPEGFAALAASLVNEAADVRLETSVDLVEATQDAGAYVQLSGVLKRLAVKLSKICNDLRLLSSGPRAGLNEINLPPMQPGSSIMPGKVNPVIPEVVNEIAFQVVGCDATVTFAAEAGQLELNAMLPIISYNLFLAINILRAGCEVLGERCVAGITANRANCRRMAESSLSLATALCPHVGYERAAKIAKTALAEDKTVLEVALDMGVLPEERLRELLRPENMLQPMTVGACGAAKLGKG
jgi:aspartate ammonia-lyase